MCDKNNGCITLKQITVCEVRNLKERKSEWLLLSIDRGSAWALILIIVVFVSRLHEVHIPVNMCSEASAFYAEFKRSHMMNMWRAEETSRPYVGPTASSLSSDGRRHVPDVRHHFPLWVLDTWLRHKPSSTCPPSLSSWHLTSSPTLLQHLPLLFLPLIHQLKSPEVTFLSFLKQPGQIFTLFFGSIVSGGRGSELKRYVRETVLMSDPRELRLPLRQFIQHEKIQTDETFQFLIYLQPPPPSVSTSGN